MAAPDLARDLKLNKIDDQRFSTVLSEQWNIFGPNGGYISSLAMCAAGRVAAIKRPATLHVQYLRPGRFEEAIFLTEVVHRGARSEFITVNVMQRDKTILHATLRTCSDGPGVAYDDSSQIGDRAQAGPDAFPTYEKNWDNYSGTFFDNMERKLIFPEPKDLKRCVGVAKDEQWVRFLSSSIDDPFVDASRSIILLDTFFFPASFKRTHSMEYVAVSLDLTVFFHRLPTSTDWLRIDARAPIACNGMIKGDGATYTLDGLVAATGYSHLLFVPAPSR